MPTKVTDPAVLAKLNAGQPKARAKVTDPVLLAKLNGAPAPVAQPQADPGAEALSLASQGASGFNEGLANTLGAPVQLMTTAMNAGIGGINKLTGTNIPTIEHPVGGQEMFRDLLSPTIAAPTDDKAGQVVRRIGEEAGAMSIPGLGLAAKTARPLATIGAELTSSLVGGTGAAAAQQVVPGNPWAELAGELAGGFTPGALVNTVRRAAASKAAPTIEELMSAKNAAYKAADDAGVRYSGPAFKTLAARMVKSAIDDNISAARHPVAVSMLKDIAKRADSGHAPTLTELDQLRQVIRRDVVNPSYGNPAMAADAHFGQGMLDDIDHFIATSGPKEVVAGDPAKAGALILTARELNTRLRKTEIIQDALERAKLNASSSGSGGNINNAIRQSFKSILLSPKKLRSFSTQERATINGLVRQNRMDELLRYVGKLSPGGSGLTGLLEVAATVAHPGMAALPAAGFAAKVAADARTVGKAERLGADVARGAPAAKIKATPAQLAAAKASLAAQLANLTGHKPVEITVPGGSTP